jgi:hypothetical protein
MGPTLATSEGADAAWEQLDDIADALEQGDSLRELIAALVAARRAFASHPHAPADDHRDIVARFVNAVLAAVVWERLAVDATKPPMATSRLRHARTVKPAEPRLSTGPMTQDELGALEILAQDAATSAATTPEG